MDHVQYKAIRKRIFPDDPAALLREMGYDYGRLDPAASVKTLRTRARQYENGKRPIPPPIARFAWLLDQWRLLAAKEDGDLTALPDWPEGV